MFNQLLKGRDGENKPVVPYVHQPFPKTLHHPEMGTRTVDDAETNDAMLANGWYETPADFPTAAEQHAVSDPAKAGGDTPAATIDLEHFNQLTADFNEVTDQRNKLADELADATLTIAALNEAGAAKDGEIAKLAEEVKTLNEDIKALKKAAKKAQQQ